MGILLAIASIRLVPALLQMSLTAKGRVLNHAYLNSAFLFNKTSASPGDIYPSSLCSDPAAAWRPAAAAKNISFPSYLLQTVSSRRREAPAMSADQEQRR